MIQANPQTKQVNVETQAPAAQIERAITEAGYTIAAAVGMKTVIIKLRAVTSQKHPSQSLQDN